MQVDCGQRHFEKYGWILLEAIRQPIAIENHFVGIRFVAAFYQTPCSGRKKLRSRYAHEL
jgi:hypothetical protein